MTQIWSYHGFYRDDRNDTIHDFGKDLAETTERLLSDSVKDVITLASVIQQSIEV